MTEPSGIRTLFKNKAEKILCHYQPPETICISHVSVTNLHPWFLATERPRHISQLVCTLQDQSLPWSLPFRDRLDIIILDYHIRHESTQYHVTFDHYFIMVEHLRKSDVPVNWKELIKITQTCQKNMHSTYPLNDTFNSPMINHSLWK